LNHSNRIAFPQKNSNANKQQHYDDLKKQASDKIQTNPVGQNHKQSICKGYVLNGGRPWIVKSKPKQTASLRIIKINFWELYETDSLRTRPLF
jgi:hypothetical protein